jgi:hypothetical protein
MFSRHATKQNGQLTLIQRDVDELKGMVREMQTSLSGSGGAPGLLINFATLCQRVSSIETILGNDIGMNVHDHSEDAEGGDLSGLVLMFQVFT